MFDYSFKEDEVLLCNAEVLFDSEKQKSEIYLTNLFLTIVKPTTTDDGEKERLTNPVSEIKVYNGIPQIKRNALHFDVFFVNNVVSFDFTNKKDANLFMNAALTLLTGKTTAQRNADAFNGIVSALDEALDMDTKSTVKEAAKAFKDRGIKGLFGITAVKRDKNKDGKATDTAKIESSETPERDDFELKYSRLKKLKELYDAEILTKEEFERKKKELLGEE